MIMTQSTDNICFSEEEKSFLDLFFDNKCGGGLSIINSYDDKDRNDDAADDPGDQ